MWFRAVGLLGQPPDQQVLSALPEDLLEMQVLRPHPGPPVSATTTCVPCDPVHPQVSEVLLWRSGMMSGHKTIHWLTY